MFEKFYPTELAVSSYDIDYERMYSKGMRGLIYDIDNTLVMHGADANEEAVSLFTRLTKMGYSVCFISNNKEPRVRRFYDGLATGGVCTDKMHYLFKADKPSRKNYRKAMEIMGTDETNTCFIGDQLFTDVYGANRTGIKSILVKPIDKHEEIQIVLKRKLEKPLLMAYHHRNRKKNDKKSIVLIGFMGSGKSTIGRALEKKLKCVYLDTDAFIEAKEGMSISEMFAVKGEKSFREAETEVLRGLCKDTKRMVISTGGGMPLRSENRVLLKKLGIVVYLKTSPENVIKRLEGDTTRPLLQRPDKEEAVTNMMRQREPAYKESSDFTVYTDGKTVDEIVKEIELMCL